LGDQVADVARLRLALAVLERDSLLVEIIRSAATSFSSLPDFCRCSLRTEAMLRRGPSGPVTLSTGPGQPAAAGALTARGHDRESHPATVPPRFAVRSHLL
jgi:hypothetical protein